MKPAGQGRGQRGVAAHDLAPALGLALVLAVPLGTPALAHPHVFIDTEVEVVLDDQGLATGLRISWTYDDLFSLVIIEDMGLDPDFDGILTEDEAAVLSGFDMKWDAGFPGDTYALLGEEPLVLSRPAEWTASYADARITSTHLRTFDTPVSLQDRALVVQVYDPGFYTAYTLAAASVQPDARGCVVELWEPDRAAADARLEAALTEYAGSGMDAETDFPAIGSAYAEEARVTCAAG